MPTQIPFIRRPPISMPEPLTATWMAVPTSQNVQATKTALRRLNLPERGPAKRAPMTEPAARAEPMAP